MNPKQRMIAALRLEQPDDIVPTFELLGLMKELTGKDFALLDELAGRELENGIVQNAALLVEVAALMEGDAEKITASVLYCLKHAKPGGGFIYISANSVYLPIRAEDHLLMLDIRKQYGRYDREVEIPL